jgi:hypothetical protein
MVIVVGLHLLLACGFMLAFFHAPVTPVQNIESVKKQTFSLSVLLKRLMHP